ncbi:Rv3654c family TadE-like protein [Streptomyces subrutilus]|uniref:Rv3654c family TadE-like protein n=1 Tax=Streptomyces subrutilus TaxID=36818 RepID=UPI003420B0FD
MSRDRGSATVWAALVATVLGAVFGGVLLLGQAVVARHRAAAAADLAALAAAATWAHGPERACAAALRVARAQDAALDACRLSGEVAEVTAHPATGPFAPEIRARAGPPAERQDPRVGGPTVPAGTPGPPAEGPGPYAGSPTAPGGLAVPPVGGRGPPVGGPAVPTDLAGSLRGDRVHLSPARARLPGPADLGTRPGSPAGRPELPAE